MATIDTFEEVVSEKVSQADIDRLLYTTGQEYCKSSEPRCAECWFGDVCAYAERRAQEERI